MMMELIDREAVEKITWEEPAFTDALNVLSEVRDKVRELPTVQAVPIEKIKTLINDIEVMRTSPALIDNGDVQRFAENVLYALNNLIKEGK